MWLPEPPDQNQHGRRHQQKNIEGKCRLAGHETFHFAAKEIEHVQFRIANQGSALARGG